MPHLYGNTLNPEDFEFRPRPDRQLQNVYEAEVVSGMY